MGRILILIGAALVICGLLISVGERVGLGRLPGDIIYRGKNTTFYFPWVTCLVISIVISLLLWLVQRR